MQAKSKTAYVVVCIIAVTAITLAALSPAVHPSVSQAQAIVTNTPTPALTPTPSPQVGEPPWWCAGNCQYAGERLLSSQTCNSTSAEGITYKLVNTGVPITDTEFSAIVCLFDFNGHAVACNRDSTCGYDVIGDHRTVSGVASETWELVGPINVPIWKVRWFACSGQGYVEFYGDQYCIDSCLEDTDCYENACEPDQCDEQFIPSAMRPGSADYCDPDAGAPNAWETVQVAVTNDCTYSQSIQYWWTYQRDGVQREDGPYGITVPGGSPGRIYLCLTTQIVQGSDGFIRFDGLVRVQTPATQPMIHSVPL